MALYRKKPIIIKAVQYKTGMKHPALRLAYDYMTSNTPIGVGIKTLEGFMIVNDGDWIIKGIHGEFYPCKNAIFQKTYEKVDVEDAQYKDL